MLPRRDQIPLLSQICQCKIHGCSSNSGRICASSGHSIQVNKYTLPSFSDNLLRRRPRWPFGGDNFGAESQWYRDILYPPWSPRGISASNDEAHLENCSLTENNGSINKMSTMLIHTCWGDWDVVGIYRIMEGDSFLLPFWKKNHLQNEQQPP